MACSKCASIIHIRKKSGYASIARAEAEDGMIEIPENLMCHLNLIPKYTKVEHFFLEVWHTLLLSVYPKLFIPWQESPVLCGHGSPILRENVPNASMPGMHMDTPNLVKCTKVLQWSMTIMLKTSIDWYGDVL